MISITLSSVFGVSASETTIKCSVLLCAATENRDGNTDDL